MKEFYIDDDGIRLHCKLDMPENKVRCPLVILFHGLTGHMEEEHIIAATETMNACGYAVLRTEQYGHGKSGGAFEDHTILKWINNAMRITEYAKSLDFVTDLYVSGHSQGGLLAIMTAGMRPDDFKGMIPLSPALNIPDLARQGNFLGMFAFDPDHIQDEFDLGDVKLKGDYFRAAQLIYPDDMIAKYKGPVLLIHGAADEAVPLSYSIDANEKFADSKLVIIQDSDHNYHGHLDEFCNALKGYLEEQK